MTEHRNVLGRILDWLRGGYPDGVPQQDYVALFGVLSRSCTPEEIEKIALELRHEGLLSSAEPEAEIRTRIEHYLHEKPREEDVRRVAARLAAGGWPLEKDAIALSEPDSTPPSAAAPTAP